MAGTKVKQRKTHKWADFRKEAEQRSAGRGGDDRRARIEPFIIDDVEPPIVIPPPDEKAILVISEQIGILSTDLLDPAQAGQRVLPLLRAFCGPQFPRVWALLPAEGATEAIFVLLQALLDHFELSVRDAKETADLPGGSGASSH